MPEPLPPLAPRSPLAGLLAATGGGVVLAERTGLAVFAIQARNGRAADLARLARERFGVELPQGPRRVAAGPLAFLGVGPGKWLLLHEGEAAPAGLAALAEHAAVVDQSDAYAIARITGPFAREALQRALPLDLHPRAFGEDGVAVTLMAHIGVTLWQPEEGIFEIAAPRSYAHDLAHALLLSAAGFATHHAA